MQNHNEKYFIINKYVNNDVHKREKDTFVFLLFSKMKKIRLKFSPILKENLTNIFSDSGRNIWTTKSYNYFDYYLLIFWSSIIRNVFPHSPIFKVPSPCFYLFAPPLLAEERNSDSSLSLENEFPGTHSYVAFSFVFYLFL